MGIEDDGALAPAPRSRIWHGPGMEWGMGGADNISASMRRSLQISSNGAAADSWLRRGTYAHAERFSITNVSEDIITNFLLHTFHHFVMTS
jgi:hypothetical protein